MEDFWCKVGPVRPHDGPQLLVHSHVSKEANITKRFEDPTERPAKLLRQIDVTGQAVGKR